MRPFVELDVDLGVMRTALYLVSTKRALAVPRVRAIADLLAEELARVEANPPHPVRRSAAPGRR